MGTDNEVVRHPVIFFDGVCNLCSSSVNFILDRDHNGIFRFSSLQSDIAKERLADHELDPAKLDSIVLLVGDKLYIKSDAILEIAKKLQGFWKILYYVGRLFPRKIRDKIYEYIAKNRYSWFGKRDECRIPTPDIKERFLDS